MKSTCKLYSPAILLFWLISSFSFGQDAAMNSINENDLKAHLDFIASDLLKGRKLGKSELEIAANYLVSNLKKMNVKPASEKDNYLQGMDFISVEPDVQNTFIKIRNAKNEYMISRDSILSLFPPPKNLKYNGSIVFAGYGIIDSANSYNDFAQINVKDKIIMIMSRTSELVNKEKSSNKNPFFYDLEYRKIAYAAQNGAKTILWVLDPNNKYKSFYEIENELYEFAKQAIYIKEKLEIMFPLDFIIITQHTADLILKSSGKSLLDLQNKITATQKPYSFEIKKTTIDLQICRIVKDFISSNIIGYIEGSDPVLKNEYIIYTAHYDHLGVDQNGKIYNGADDNGSGTVALLEIAEAFTKLPNNPKRSIVFAWMTAEEIGGIGSQYYVNHPLFPLEKTVTCINLDMIGRVKTSDDKHRMADIKNADSLFVISGANSSELLKINSSICSKFDLNPDYFDKKQRLEYSDQFFFYQKGIPVLFYHNGFNQDTHSTNDIVKKIDFVKMKKVAQVAFSVGFEVANNDKKLEVDKPINNISVK